MAESTTDPIRDIERALERVKQLARAALHVMENVEMEDVAGNGPRGDAVFTIHALLEAIEDTADAGQCAALPSLAART